MFPVLMFQLVLQACLVVKWQAFALAGAAGVHVAVGAAASAGFVLGTAAAALAAGEADTEAAGSSDS